MSSFRTSFHMTTGRRMIEVWHDNALIAAIYASDGPNFRIITKHDLRIEPDGVAPRAVRVEIKVR